MSMHSIGQTIKSLAACSLFTFPEAVAVRGSKIVDQESKRHTKIADTSQVTVVFIAAVITDAVFCRLSSLLSLLLSLSAPCCSVRWNCILLACFRCALFILLAVTMILWSLVFQILCWSFCAHGYSSLFFPVSRFHIIHFQHCLN